MRRQHQSIFRTSRFFIAALLGTFAAIAAAPGDAAADVQVRASIGGPVRATLVVGDGPRLWVQPKPTGLRRVVVREPACSCERHEHRDHHRRHGHDRGPARIWVTGHWEPVSARTAHWVPGHWEIERSGCGR